MTLPSSGRHRDPVPSPTNVEPTPAFLAEASGPHSSDRHRDPVPSPTNVEPTPALLAEASGPRDEGLAPPPGGPPLLTVVRGTPTAEELAALTVVVAALSQRRTRRRPVPVGAWSSFGNAHRRPLRPGPGGWRASGRYA